jgi:FkbM family methyltransferase
MLPNWIKRNKRTIALEASLDALLADHASLLQAAARSLELADEGRLAVKRVEAARVESNNALMREIASVRQAMERVSSETRSVLRRREAANIEELASVTTRLDVAAHDWDMRFAELERRLDEDRQFSAERVKRIVAEIRANPADFGLLNPEAGLMAHLYSYLPATVAIDVGANRGGITERLLNAGYEVYAFEPYAPMFEILQKALGARSRLHNIAIGSADMSMRLHIAQDMSPDRRYKDPSQLSSLIEHPMPDDLPFVSAVEVRVRSLRSLAEEGLVPRDIGLLKIDTEGYDLEVIRGMGNLRPHVLVAEYWAPDFVFGQSGALNRLDELVQEVRERGYRWYIVFYRLAGSDRVSYYCNYDQSVSNSWGNVFFFQEREHFLRALDWCSATLPATYFHSVTTVPQVPVMAHATQSLNVRAFTEVPHDARLDAARDGALGTLGERLDQLSKETARFRNEVGAHERVLAVLTSAVARLEGTLAHRQAQADEQASRSLQIQIGELEHALADRSREVEELKAGVGRVKRSYSWKLTSPLREIRRAGVRLGRFMGGSQ